MDKLGISGIKVRGFRLFRRLLARREMSERAGERRGCTRFEIMKTVSATKK